MTEQDKEASTSKEVGFRDGLEQYQEKQALQKMLHYISEEATRLGYTETESKILIAAGTLEKEYNKKLS